MSTLRNLRILALTAASLLTVGSTVSCVTDSGGSVRRRGSNVSGMAVEADADTTWQRVRGIAQGMTNDPLINNGADRSFRTTIDGSETTVRVESTGSQASEVFVSSKNPTVVQKIQSALRR